MTLTTFEIAAEHYSELQAGTYTSLHKVTYKNGFTDGAQWQQSQNTWNLVSEKTPPTDCQLLVQNPDGINYLTEWRESFKIFTCQAKSESSLDWKWKLI